jgi:CAAX protease family protein
LLLKNELSKSNLKKEPFTYNLILSVILLGISFYLVIIPITEIIPLKESKLDEIIIYMQQNNIFMILFAVIIGPILEEYLFRGILLKSLLTQYSPIVSILITSFLFSLMHLNIGIPIDSFFFAIVVGWLYLKMKSVIPCIILHSIYNGLAQLHKLFVLSDENKLLSSSEIVGNELLYYSIILISTFILISIIVWLNKILSTNKKYT